MRTVPLFESGYDDRRDSGASGDSFTAELPGFAKPASKDKDITIEYPEEFNKSGSRTSTNKILQQRHQPRLVDPAHKRGETSNAETPSVQGIVQAGGLRAERNPRYCGTYVEYPNRMIDPRICDERDRSMLTKTKVQVFILVAGGRVAGIEATETMEHRGSDGDIRRPEQAAVKVDRAFSHVKIGIADRVNRSFHGIRLDRAHGGVVGS